MKHMYRNHNCGELTIKNVGEEVVLAGWIQRIRNLGAMKFIDLRDQFGITQIVISDNEDIQEQQLFKLQEMLLKEVAKTQKLQQVILKSTQKK